MLLFPSVYTGTVWAKKKYNGRGERARRQREKCYLKVHLMRSDVGSCWCSQGHPLLRCCMQGRNENRTKNIARAPLLVPQNRKEEKEGFKTQLPPPLDAAPAQHHNICMRSRTGSFTPPYWLVSALHRRGYECCWSVATRYDATVNRKGSGRKRSWPNRGPSPTISWRD